ncbi:hypothetical protein OEZ71_01885 [Defluviimonas sp. WL0050]|uniref:Uncharacterized protein n=1 Tax=Albidovulum litorale TaxID=2984134 RepID=A0ABT2ZJ21_9RHOB|nr:hypothetical protein [Defluviimonas sp. WL0050]MCV2871038.1 hypothetical protein [Defluviimonas sp. WL0050]
MTPDQRNYLSMERSTHYFGIMRTTIFTFAGLAALIHLGPDGYSAPLLMLVIATTAYGVLAGGTSLDDLIALRDDMDDEMKATHYGKGLAARNIPMLKNISAGLLGLIGLAEVLAILI